MAWAPAGHEKGGKIKGHGGHNGQGKIKHSDHGKDHRQRQEVRQKSNQKDAKLVSCLLEETHGPCVNNKESGAPHCPEPGYECGKHNMCCPQVKGRPKGICVFTKEGGQRLCPRANYSCMGPNPSKKNRKMPMCYKLKISKKRGGKHEAISAQRHTKMERSLHSVNQAAGKIRGIETVSDEFLLANKVSHPLKKGRCTKDPFTGKTKEAGNDLVVCLTVLVFRELKVKRW
ncbi:hypothetical protein Ddc_07262 [Ditylenchus destructor]|nr:hypothetical protein Ddc_07262 [Ditylenchus destructor]